MPPRQQCPASPGHEGSEASDGTVAPFFPHSFMEENVT